MSKQPVSIVYTDFENVLNYISRQKTLNDHLITLLIRPLFSRTLNNNKSIYLANHSLGRMLDQTAFDLIEATQIWSQGKDDAWNNWLQEMEHFRQQTALLLQAESHNQIIPKTSAGQGLRSILNCFQKPLTVLTSADEFNSIDFILKAYAQKKRIKLTSVQPSQPYHYHLDDFLAKLETQPDLIVLSLVMFKTAQIFPEIKQLIAAAHKQGCMVLLDLYHAAGAIPVNIKELGADFAIGGSYKYLRGGPGAAWLYIHEKHLQGQLRTLDTGWFAQDQQFQFNRPDQPEYAQGGNAFLESTPAILPFYQARAGLKFSLACGIEKLRDYNLIQHYFLQNLLDKYQIPYLGQAEQRGAFIAIPLDNANNHVQEMQQSGIICDHREGLLRLCPDLLNTGEELEKAVLTLANIRNTLLH